jgi:hypothetical protein
MSSTASKGCQHSIDDGSKFAIKSSNIPKHIHIGGLRVKIAIVENLEDFGSFSLDDLTISLRKGHIKEMTDTLRHEMMHAAFAIGGIAHCKPFEEVEEGVVRCLDHLFFPAWGKLQQTKQTNQ